NDDVVGGFYKVLQWSPLVLAPLLIAQLYSDKGTVPISALFASLRRERGTPADVRHASFDLSGAFAVSCWIAASVGEQRTRGFSIVLVLLMASMLCQSKPRSTSLPRWALVVIFAAVLGVALQSLMYGAQERAESWAVQWMQDADATDVSPDRAFTAIGMLGRLKFSDRIQIRVRTNAPLTKPLLLREATYGQYQYGTWRNADSARNAIDPVGDGHTWILGEQVDDLQRATIIAPFKAEVTVLPLPQGVRTMSSNGVIGVQRNAYGTILVDARPGFVSYETSYSDGVLVDSQPLAGDLELPSNYEQTFAKLDTEIRHDANSAAATIAGVKAFFDSKFEYSLVQKAKSPWRQPLQDFLLSNRRGHCEYFATATTLLLRHYGIPARYAVGYAVSEYSTLNAQYIARRRDAHAWTLAWFDGRWQVVDTTPAAWRAREDEESSSWSVVSDFADWVKFKWSQLRVSSGGIQQWLPWFLPPLIVVLLWRLRRTRMSVSTRRNSNKSDVVRAGADSEFYELLQSMTVQGFEPSAGETVAAWTERMCVARPSNAETLRSLMRLHCRLRFDPRGLSVDERNALRSGVTDLTRALAN
ncbi:MAG: transglutaminase domain-containing protein, partial [Gammaproteobacteria bacterium]